MTYLLLRLPEKKHIGIRKDERIWNLHPSYASSVQSLFHNQTKVGTSLAEELSKTNLELKVPKKRLKFSSRQFAFVWFQYNRKVTKQMPQVGLESFLVLSLFGSKEWTILSSFAPLARKFRAHYSQFLNSWRLLFGWKFTSIATQPPFYDGI